jgi:hypothetical protein
MFLYQLNFNLKVRRAASPVNVRRRHSAATPAIMEEEAPSEFPWKNDP